MGRMYIHLNYEDLFNVDIFTWLIADILQQQELLEQNFKNVLGMDWSICSGIYVNLKAPYLVSMIWLSTAGINIIIRSALTLI